MYIFKIKTLTENDIDYVIGSAGGEKIDTSEREKKSEKTADYLLNDAIIELKLIDEEGLSKLERKEKLAALFNENQKDRPTVILHTSFLNNNDLGKYYRILETPIKTHVKKAANQLKKTEQTLYNNKIKVLLIINNGYTSLDIDTFQKICFHRVKNDTHNIDFLIVAGVYFYGDGFDFYSLFPFELYKITNKEFPDFIKLRDAWNNFSEIVMTKMIREPESIDFNRLPVYDISYKINEKHYINPTPPIGKKSDFYINGRPRKNSTDFNKCPYVATTYPLLNEEEWILAKSDLIDDYQINESYEEYYNAFCDELKIERAVIQPFVPIQIQYSSFKNWCIETDSENLFYSLCLYANELFNERIRSLIFSAKNIEENKIEPTRYIYLFTEEIGQDKIYDISSAFIINQTLYQNNETAVFENLNIFYEYGLSLACSYAIKNNIDIVYYKLDKTFGWY